MHKLLKIIGFSLLLKGYLVTGMQLLDGHVIDFHCFGIFSLLYRISVDDYSSFAHMVELAKRGEDVVEPVRAKGGLSGRVLTRSKRKEVNDAITHILLSGVKKIDGRLVLHDPITKDGGQEIYTGGLMIPKSFPSGEIITLELENE